MKKILFISAVLVFIPVVALAQGFVALAPIPGLTQGVTADSAGLANFFNNLYKYLIGLAATLAVIEIIWGGLEYSTQDSVSKKSDGKNRIIQAIFGLVLVLSPVLVFSIINPSILNLSLNLPKLDTAPVPQQPSTPTISDAEIQSRESSGGSVLYSFNIDLLRATEPVRKTLATKQVACTDASGGPGIILAVLPLGLGNYVCQTCPPNTDLVLYPPNSDSVTARGSCQVK